MFIMLKSEKELERMYGPNWGRKFHLSMGATLHTLGNKYIEAEHSQLKNKKGASRSLPDICFPAFIFVEDKVQDNFVSGAFYVPFKLFDVIPDYRDFWEKL